MPTHRRPIGYMFQEASLFAHLSVMGNLRYGMKRITDTQRVSLDQAIELLCIGHLLDRKPDRLSGGERQRVVMARALAVSPRYHPKTRGQTIDTLVIAGWTGRVVHALEHLIREREALGRGAAEARADLLPRLGGAARHHAAHRRDRRRFLGRGGGGDRVPVRQPVAGRGLGSHRRTRRW